MEADENWAVGFQSNRLTPFYGNGATAKIDIFEIPMMSGIVFSRTVKACITAIAEHCAAIPSSVFPAGA